MSETTYELSCDCGQVKMAVRGEPKLSLYCHCRSCRALYGTDIVPLTGWAEESVDLPDASTMFDYKLSDCEMRRFGCPNCGMTLYARHRPGIPVIPHGVFRRNNGGELPTELAPTLHLFYRDRVLEMGDDLPKSEGGEMIGM